MNAAAPFLTAQFCVQSERVGGCNGVVASIFCSFPFCLSLFSFSVVVRSKLDKDNANISGLFWVNPQRTSQNRKAHKTFHLLSHILPFLSFCPFQFWYLRSLLTFLFAYNHAYTWAEHSFIGTRSFACSFSFCLDCFSSSMPFLYNIVCVRGACLRPKFSVCHGKWVIIHVHYTP